MKKKIIIIVIIAFLQGIVTNLNHPLTPSYVSSIGLPKYMFGFLFSFMNLGIMIGSPIFGNLSDMGKKKTSLVIGLLIYGIAQMLFGLGNFFGGFGLSILRFVSGFGIAAAFIVLVSEIINLSDQKNRTKNISYSAASLLLGSSLGQWLGGFIHTNTFFTSHFKTDDFFKMFLIQMVVTFMLAGLVLIIFKPQEDVKEIKGNGILSGFREFKNINKQLLYFLIALALITIAATNIDKYIDVYFSDLGYGANHIGNLKMTIGLVSLATNLLVVPLLIKVKKKILLISIFQFLSFIIILYIFKLSVTTFMINMYTFFMIYIIFKTALSPIEQVHIASYSNEDNVSRTMAVRQSVVSTGTIIGPLFGAFVYEYNANLLFIISALLFLSAIFFLMIANKDKTLS